MEDKESFNRTQTPSTAFFVYSSELRIPRFVSFLDGRHFNFSKECFDKDHY